MRHYTLKSLYFVLLKTTILKHILILAVATLLCWGVWSIGHFSLDTLFEDLLASAVETLVLMELSLAASKLIARFFQKREASFLS